MPCLQGLILVTDNEREFRRVSGLEAENWRLYRRVVMPGRRKVAIAFATTPEQASLRKHAHARILRTR